MNGGKFHFLLKNISKSKISTPSYRLSFLKPYYKIQNSNNKNSNKIKGYPLCVSVLTNIKKSPKNIKKNNSSRNFNFNIIKNMKFSTNNRSASLDNSNDFDINNNFTRLLKNQNLQKNKKNNQQIFSYDQKINYKELKNIKLQQVNQVNKIFSPKNLNMQIKFYDSTIKNSQRNKFNFILNKKFLSNINNDINNIPFSPINFSFKLKKLDNKNNYKSKEKSFLKDIYINSEKTNKKIINDDVIAKNENNDSKKETKIDKDSKSSNDINKINSLPKNTNNNQKDKNIFNKKNNRINKNNIYTNYINQNNIYMSNSQKKNILIYKSFIDNSTKIFKKLNKSNFVNLNRNKMKTEIKNVKLQKKDFKCFYILTKSKSNQSSKFLNKINEDVNLKLTLNNIKSKIYDSKSNLLFQRLTKNEYIDHYNPKNVFNYEKTRSYYYQNTFDLKGINTVTSENSALNNIISCNIRKELMNNLILNNNLLNVAGSDKINKSSKWQNNRCLENENNIEKKDNFPFNYMIIHSFILRSFFWINNPNQKNNLFNKQLLIRKNDNFQKNTCFLKKHFRNSTQFAVLRNDLTTNTKIRSTILKVGSLHNMKNVKNYNNKSIQRYSLLSKKSFFDIDNNSSNMTEESEAKNNKKEIINKRNKSIFRLDDFNIFKELNINNLFENLNSIDDLYIGLFSLILKSESKLFKKYFCKFEKDIEFDINRQFINLLKTTEI